MPARCPAAGESVLEAARRIGRKQQARAEHEPVTKDVEQLERRLLRRAVRLLAADRHSCSHCGRTPLVGERVHVYKREPGVVCDLCRLLHADRPHASERVLHSEHGHTVRLAARAA
jgi:hypothetical protein